MSRVYTVLLVILGCYIIVTALYIYTIDRRIKFARNMGEACNYHIERDSTRKLEMDATTGLESQYSLLQFFGGACLLVIVGKCIWEYSTHRDNLSEIVLNENLLCLVIGAFIAVGIYYARQLNSLMLLTSSMLPDYDSIKTTIGTFLLQ